jgi:hypothetical protein
MNKDILGRTTHINKQNPTAYRSQLAAYDGLVIFYQIMHAWANIIADDRLARLLLSTGPVTLR